VTVLFANVADYTPMAEKLDPEEVHQVLEGCFEAKRGSKSQTALDHPFGICPVIR
jgi:hypothetical protein